MIVSSAKFLDELRDRVAVELAASVPIGAGLVTLYQLDELLQVSKRTTAGVLQKNVYQLFRDDPLTARVGLLCDPASKLTENLCARPSPCVSGRARSKPSRRVAGYAGCPTS